MTSFLFPLYGYSITGISRKSVCTKFRPKFKLAVFGDLGPPSGPIIMPQNDTINVTKFTFHFILGFGSSIFHTRMLDRIEKWHAATLRKFIHQTCIILDIAVISLNFMDLNRRWCILYTPVSINLRFHHSHGPPAEQLPKTTTNKPIPLLIYQA